MLKCLRSWSNADAEKVGIGSISPRESFPKTYGSVLAPLFGCRAIEHGKGSGGGVMYTVLYGSAGGRGNGGRSGSSGGGGGGKR